MHYLIYSHSFGFVEKKRFVKVKQYCSKCLHYNEISVFDERRIRLVVQSHNNSQFLRMETKLLLQIQHQTNIWNTTSYFDEVQSYETKINLTRNDFHVSYSISFSAESNRGVYPLWFTFTPSSPAYCFRSPRSNKRTRLEKPFLLDFSTETRDLKSVDKSSCTSQGNKSWNWAKNQLIFLSDPSMASLFTPNGIIPHSSLKSWLIRQIKKIQSWND